MNKWEVAILKIIAAFFPESEADATHLTVEQIPIDGPIEVVAGLGMGGGDMILEHGKRRTPGVPAIMICTPSLSVVKYR